VEVAFASLSDDHYIRLGPRKRDNSDPSESMVTKECLGRSQYNSRNREPLFVPGGSAMRILVPWKPVVLMWGLLSAMIFFGFVASSVLEGKNPFAPGATVTRPAAMKTGAAQARQQPKHSQKATQAPSR